MTWWDDLLGQKALPATGGSKPASPVSPFPVLGTQQWADPRWEKRFRRLLQSGSQPGLVEIPQILMAMMALNTFGAEDYYPDDLLCFGVNAPTSAGGLITQGQIHNPAGSGKLIILEGMFISQSTLANVMQFQFITQPATKLATLGVTMVRDLRGGMLAGQPATTAVLSSANGNAAAVGNAGVTWGFFNVPTGIAPIPFPLSITLAPNTGITWFMTTAGAQQTFDNWYWRERAIGAVA